MKTIGERIRQARVARGLSGEALAIMVGYKHQSAIGNLETRVTGQGGNKIALIADALHVTLEWLLRGPDSDVVPFVTAPNTTDFAERTEVTPSFARDPEAAPFLDPWTNEAVQILSKLSEIDKRAAILCLRTFVQNLGPPRTAKLYQWPHKSSCSQ